MILCIGEAVIDMFRKQDPCFGETFYPLPGGCAYNTSIAIGKLGASVAFLGRLSRNFFGEIQLKRLQENNVKDNLLIRCEENPVLSFIKTEDGKEPQYAFYEAGTADRLLSIDDLPPQLPADTACIVFGSISMNMEPIASTIESLIFKEAGQKVIAFDPNIRPFMIKDRHAYLQRFEKWVGASTIVKISLEDFEFILPNPKPEEALEKIIAMGESADPLRGKSSRLAIVTLGPRGAMAVLKRNDGSAIRVSAPGIEVPNLVDTVGAGDTFHGAFLARLEMKGKLSHNGIAALSEDDLFEALVFANKAAAAVCSSRGAQFDNSVSC